MSDYSYLATVPEGSYPTAALASKNIKRELAKVFPGQKFTVRSSVYTGGDSVSISWTDGPTGREVDSLAKKYQEGSFDGQTDSYEYDSDRSWTNRYGGAKYVQTSRSASDDLFQTIGKALCELQGVIFAGNNTRNLRGEMDDDYLSTHIHRLFAGHSLKPGARFLRARHSLPSDPEAAEWAVLEFDPPATLISRFGPLPSAEETLNVMEIPPAWEPCITKTFPQSLRRVIEARGDLTAFDDALAGKGDFARKYEMEPYQPLSIEVIPSAMDGLAVAVSHTFSQNGDLMRDPEIVFAVVRDGRWIPYEITQHPVGRYRNAVEDGALNVAESRDILALANIWARNLRDQGWHEKPEPPAPGKIIQLPLVPRSQQALNRLLAL